MRVGAVLLVTSAALMLIGVNVRRLAALGAAGIAALPLLYLVSRPEDRGGFNFDFVIFHTRPHYLAVVAVCCLAAAALLAARQIRAVRSSR